MKVSESWLREWANPSLDTEQLAHQLTMAGLEVDAISPAAGQFTNVVVASVDETAPHPKADKLTLCTVSTGDSTYTVVCGAANVRPGIKVALAQLGATLPGGFKIKEVKLRGQLSQGMLCSASELGLEDRSEGILELAHDAPLGVALRDYMLLDDMILDIDLTPNRADCFSVLGIARETAALNHLSLKPKPAKAVPPQSDESRSISLKAAAACPHYCGRVIRGVNAAAVTPVWMKERLRRSGLRPRQPIVDVTNYVMLELGQPMHAFDLATINGDIQVRYAHERETLTLLDGQNVELSEDVLVIADAVKPQAIAGIIGGEGSCVQNETTDVFLESAYFNPASVAGVARRYGLHTDSSLRFERGVDPQLQTAAMERATDLLISIAGGKPGPIIDVSEKNQLPQPAEITFHPERVQQLTGVSVGKETMAQYLKNLGMKVNAQNEPWVVTAPSHRFDMAFEVDLIEEIIRIHGYQNIQAAPIVTHASTGTVNVKEQLESQIADFLRHRGYHETISYSFVDPDLQEALYPQAPSLKLLNPISSELSEMRVGLWPGLIASMVYNLHRQQAVIQLFETGVVFEEVGGAVAERSCIAGLLVGEFGALNWSENTRKFDFFDLKGDLEALMKLLDMDNVGYQTAEHPALHPGKSSRIIIDGHAVGWLGVLHPRLADELDIDEEVTLFELTLDALLAKKTVRYQPISKYPQIRRDLSLLVNKEIAAGQIERVVRTVVEPNLLKSFNVFDLYTGKTIPEGQKSVAVALTLQADDRTLVDSEINPVIDAIITKLKEEFAITLRD